MRVAINGAGIGGGCLAYWLEDPHHLVDGADLGATGDLPCLLRTQIAMRLSWISRPT